QKGMGLIMLILIGTVPTAYALNRAVPPSHTAQFATVSGEVDGVLKRYEPAGAAPLTGDPRPLVAAYVRDRALEPATVPALRALATDIAKQIATHGSLAKVPSEQVGNVRNDMYLSSEALRFMLKNGAPAFTAPDQVVVKGYREAL